MSKFFMCGEQGEIVNKDHVIRVCPFSITPTKNDLGCIVINIELSNSEIIIEFFDSPEERQSRMDELAILLMGLSEYFNEVNG